MSELWTLNKFNLPHVSSCADGLIVQDLRSWREKKNKKKKRLITFHITATHTKKIIIQYLSAPIQVSKTSCSHTVSCLIFLQIFYYWGFLHKLSLYTSSSLYGADKSSPLLSIRFILQQQLCYAWEGLRFANERCPTHPHTRECLGSPVPPSHCPPAEINRNRQYGCHPEAERSSTGCSEAGEDKSVRERKHWITLQTGRKKEKKKKSHKKNDWH